MGKTKTTTNTKSEKPLVFFPETENQMLIEGKPANRKRHQNRKTAVLCCENRKTDLKMAKTAKPKNPMPPSFSEISLKLTFAMTVIMLLE